MNTAVINGILAIAVQAITAARVARDAARAANPVGEDGTLPSDAEMIQKLITDSQLGQQEATALQAWLKTLTMVIVVVLLGSVPAFAQNPCTTPSDNSILNGTTPARLYAELADLTLTLPDGTAVNVDYQYGAWPAGANVQTTPPTQGPSTLPKTAFGPVPGFPGCYELTGGLPGLIPTQARMVVALRSRGQPNAQTPISQWSAPSNSFSLASTPVNPAVPGQIRVRP